MDASPNNHKFFSGHRIQWLMFFFIFNLFPNSGVQADLTIQRIDNPPGTGAYQANIPGEDLSKPLICPEDNHRSRQMDVDLRVIDDPCLPRLYKDWEEFSVDHEEYRRSNRIIAARIVVDTVKFSLTLEAILPGSEIKPVITQNVGVGDIRTPTPEGSFIINHIYCYPDVMFFGDNAKPVSGLYNGFFAPLLVCDEHNNCARHKSMGIHGFEGIFHPGHVSITPGTYGAISGGCVRISNPCSLKIELMRIVGVGPIRKNDRGCYHWLKKPVQVVVNGKDLENEQPTIVSLIEESIFYLGKEVADIFGALYR